MAASYSDLQDTPRDRIRFALADTGPTAFDLTDEAIDALVSRHGEKMATAKAARHLAALLSRRPDVLDRHGDVRLEFKSRILELGKVAEQAERELQAEIPGRSDVQGGPRVAKLEGEQGKGFRF